MEKLKEIMKNRTFWLVTLIVMFIIILIIVIKKRNRDKEQSKFAEDVKREAVKDRITEKEQELNQYLRKLWGEHANWMRQYVIAYFNGTGDVADTTKRLLKNQDQIGRSLGMWYGDKNGAKIADLMKNQLIAFGDMLNGMVSKNRNLSVIGEKKWNDNTEKLVDFLVELNNNWGRVELSQHFKRYNEMMTNMAIHRFKKKHGDEINSFDKAYSHAINDVADVLTKGIVLQHPEQFDKPALSSSADESKDK